MFVSENMSSILIPPISFLVVLGYICWWVTVALYLYTIGKPSHEKHALPFSTFEHSKIT
jgi:hypothetical protein